MTDPFLHIMPASQQLVEDYVYPEAEKDHHGVINATQVVVKDGEVIGYLSIGAVPAVYMWLHTKKTMPRDTQVIVSFIESHVLATTGNDKLIMPCQSSSPLYPYLARVGYIESDYDHVFFKNLNHIKLKAMPTTYGNTKQ
jgi:hypothetical protein